MLLLWPKKNKHDRYLTVNRNAACAISSKAKIVENHEKSSIPVRE
jgi:hypothetical protein